MRKYCVAVDLTEEIRPAADVRWEVRAGERDGLAFEPVTFARFRDFYRSIVAVEKSPEVWAQLEKEHFAFMVAKDGVPVAAAAFKASGKQVYYSMSVTDYSLSCAKHAGYVLQIQVMHALKAQGYEWYVVGTEDTYQDLEKSKRIWNFKKHFGDLYIVEGEAFPYLTYVPVIRSDGEERYGSPVTPN